MPYRPGPNSVRGLSKLDSPRTFLMDFVTGVTYRRKCDLTLAAL